jgi:palmitoyltransferase
MGSNGALETDPAHAWKQDSIEERSFGAALICIEGHYNQAPVMGPLTISKVMSVVSKTLEKTHTFKDVRYVACPCDLESPRLMFGPVERFFPGI